MDDYARLGKQPTCKNCGLLYPVEYSKHPWYCDDCYKGVEKDMNKLKKELKK